MPEEDEKTIKPIDCYHGAFALYRSDYAGSHLCGIELHGETAAFYQWCLDKAGPDVRDVYVAYALDGGQLAEALEIMTCEAFRCGLGGCGTKPFCTCY